MDAMDGSSKGCIHVLVKNRKWKHKKKQLQCMSNICK